jgi:hypothetical protein
MTPPQGYNLKAEPYHDYFLKVLARRSALHH